MKTVIFGAGLTMLLIAAPVFADDGSTMMSGTHAGQQDSTATSGSQSVQSGAAAVSGSNAPATMSGTGQPAQ